MYLPHSAGEANNQRQITVKHGTATIQKQNQVLSYGHGVHSKTNF